MGTSKSTEPLQRASARSATGLRPVTPEERRKFKQSTGRNLPKDAMTSDFLQRGTRVKQSGPVGGRSRGAGTGAVSREEFERATGRTPSGRKARRKK